MAMPAINPNRWPSNEMWLLIGRAPHNSPPDMVIVTNATTIDRMVRPHATRKRPFPCTHVHFPE